MKNYKYYFSLNPSPSPVDRTKSTLKTWEKILTDSDKIETYLIIAVPELLHGGQGADLVLVLGPGVLVVLGGVPHGPALLQLVLWSRDGLGELEAGGESHVDALI